MKKFVVPVCSVILTLAMTTACNNEKKEVKQTAEAFLKALIAGDFESTKALTTEETQAKWGDFSQFAADNISVETKEAIASSQVKVSDISVKGDEAEAVCSAVIPYFVEETTVLHLKKVGDKWLIDEPNTIVVDRVTEDVIALDTDTVTIDEMIVVDSVKIEKK